MYQVLPGYPGDAARGADYFSGAPHGTIIETHGDEQTERAEQVLDTGLHIEFEGRVCVGERTVRHWATLFGMVDGWRVQNLMRQAQADVDERDLLSRELAEARQQIANLLEVQQAPAVEVFVASNGSRHASPEAAESESRKVAGLASKALVGVRPLTVEEAPAS